MKAEFTKEEIRDKAKQLIRSVGLKGKFPLDVFSVAKSLGYAVVPIDWDDPEMGKLSGWVDATKKIIGINSQEPPYRQLFTIAHEIAHIVLHKPDFKVEYRESRMQSFRDKPPKEREADYFAACLLMPEREFIKQFYKKDGDLAGLGDYFRVSLSSCAIRCEELDLI